MPTADNFKSIDMLDPRRDTGECGSVFVWSILRMFCNLAKICYTYMLTSYTMTILLVYLVCYMLLGSYVYSIGTLITGLNIATKTSHISNK